MNNQDDKTSISNLDFEEVKFVSCECSSPDHALQMSYYDDDVNNDTASQEMYIPELYFNLQLSPYLGFWKRLWLGFRYIFGFTERRYSHWNCCLISEDGAKDIIKYCEIYLKDTEKAKKLNKRKRKIY